MRELKPNSYLKSLADAHTIVCDLCLGDWDFPWYYIFDFWPFNRKWRAYKKLNRVSQYLYEEFQKESWFVR